MDEHCTCLYIITKHYGKGIYSLQGVDDPDGIRSKSYWCLTEIIIDQPDEYVTMVNIVYYLYIMKYFLV